MRLWCVVTMTPVDILRSALVNVKDPTGSIAAALNTLSSQVDSVGNWLVIENRTNIGLCGKGNKPCYADIKV